MPGDFSFDGLDAVLARMEQFGEDVVEAADEAVQSAAGEGADAVSANVPVRTGDLQRTVQHNNRGWAIATIEVGAGLPYVRPVEKRTAFFNRSVQPILDGLLERVSSAIQAKAFR